MSKTVTVISYNWNLQDNIMFKKKHYYDAFVIYSKNHQLTTFL